MRGWTKLGVVCALALATLVVSGCRRRGPVYDARRIQRYERNLFRVAARDSGCPAAQVQPVRIAETVWTVNTCTGPREYFLACRQSRRRWAHCSWRRIPTVNESAATFLGCPPQMIQAQVGPNPMMRGAVGCGRQVHLALQCNPVGCGWAAMGPAASAAPAPPPGYGSGAVIVVPAN